MPIRRQCIEFTGFRRSDFIRIISTRGDAARFRLISEAHEVLSDPQRRSSYDNEHRKARRTATPEPFEAPKPAPSIKDEVQRRDEILLLLYRRASNASDSAEPRPSRARIAARHSKGTARIQPLVFEGKRAFEPAADSARHTITLQGVQLAEAIT